MDLADGFWKNKLMHRPETLDDTTFDPTAPMCGSHVVNVIWSTLASKVGICHFNFGRQLDIIRWTTEKVSVLGDPPAGWVGR